MDVQDAITPHHRWESLAEQSVRHCEDSGVDAYTERKCQHGDRGEARAAAQDAERVADVPQHLIKPSPTPGISRAFAHQQRPAESTRRRRAIAELPRFHVDVEPQFLVEAVIEGSPPQPGINSPPQLGHSSSLRFQHAFDGPGHGAELFHFGP